MTLPETPPTRPSKFYLATGYSLFAAAVFHIIIRGERVTQKLSFATFIIGFLLFLRYPECLVAAVHTLTYLGSFSFGGITALIGLLILLSGIFIVRIIFRLPLFFNLPILILIVFFFYTLVNWYFIGHGNPDGFGKLKLFFIRGVIPAAIILTFGSALKRLNLFLSSTVVFSFLSSIMVVASYLGLSRMHGQWGESGRITFFGFDPISFSLPIGLSCVILAHYFLRGSRTFYKPVLIGLFGFMFFSIFPTGSRQTVLALVFGILIYSIIAFRTFLTKSLATIAVTLTLIAGFFIIISQYQSERFDVLSEGYLKNTSFQGRISSIQSGWDTFKKAPLFGTGAGGYGKYIYVFNPVTGKTVKQKGHIHNLFIELLAEQGMAGLFLFLLPMIIGSWKLLSALRSDPDDMHFRSSAAIMFALLGFAVVQANISGGISVTGGLIVTLIAWMSVIAKEKRVQKINSPI